MGIKTCLAGLCLAVLAATVIDVPPVEAQTKKKQDGPRARITVEPRSFLDAGTEVLPGERKFTDYALPAGSYSMPLSWCKALAGAWAGTSRRCRGHSIFQAAIIRTVGNPGLHAHHGSRRWLARSVSCSQCAVILAACAVSVQFLRSVAMVRFKSPLACHLRAIGPVGPLRSDGMR